MPKRKLVGFCSVFGCGEPIDSVGLCTVHYHRKWQYDRTEKVNTGLKRTHPLYVLWHERKMMRALAPEWVDFWGFVKGVGEKPGPQYFLMRPDGNKPYGPDNFIWQEHLKRKPGEPRKVWWARKWQVRHANNRGIERRRELKRRYGLTSAQYDAMLADQDGVCAICGEQETSFDPKTGSRKNLAVDHCHKTLAVRALLCFRCNSTVGRLGESVELARSITAYIEKHSTA